MGHPGVFRQPGLDRESTLWLVNQGIHMIGIDAWTLDREFAAQIEEFKRTGDGRHIWPAHFAACVTTCVGSSGIASTGRAIFAMCRASAVTDVTDHVASRAWSCV